MSLIHFDSFNFYSSSAELARAYSLNSSGEIGISANGIGGRPTVALEREPAAVGYELPTPVTPGSGRELYFSFDFYVQGDSTQLNEPCVSVGNASMGLGDSQRDSDHFMYIRPDDSGSQFLVWANGENGNAQIGTLTLPPNTAYRMEIRVKPSSDDATNDGELRIVVDGIEEFSYTGVLYSDGEDVSKIVFGGLAFSSSSGQLHVGALVVWDSEGASPNSFPLGGVAFDTIDAVDAALNSDDGDTSTVEVPGTLAMADGSGLSGALGAKGFIKARTAGGSAARPVNLALSTANGNASIDVAIPVSESYVTLLTPMLATTSSDLSSPSIVVSDL